MTKASDERLEVAKQIFERLSVMSGHTESYDQVQLLDQGDQALLYMAIFIRDGEVDRQSPFGDRVVKIYKDRTAIDMQAFENEVQALRVIHGLLNGWQHGDLKIQTPTLFCASERHMAMAMSRMPGASIQSGLASIADPAEISEAVFSALMLLWSNRILYGDLNLANILYDAPSSTISFIDPGMPAEFFRCDDVSANWFPASRDLAYLAFSVAVRLKYSFIKPFDRRRQLSFVRAILHQFLNTIPSGESQVAVVEEMRGCANIHLERLEVSLSPSGLWRLAVKRFTRRCLETMFSDLASHVASVGNAK
jgi:tRNA A-37 threonylcarbamoyl transferase component Bud32